MLDRFLEVVAIVVAVGFVICMGVLAYLGG